MNTPGSRAELESMGFSFQKRCPCKAPECGATLEWWQAASGRWVPFRLHPSGKLFQHTDECPGRHHFRGKRAEEKPLIEKPKAEPKKKPAPEPQGVLFR